MGSNPPPQVTPLLALNLRFIGFGITVSLGRVVPNFVDLSSNLTKIAKILNDMCASGVMFETYFMDEPVSAVRHIVT